MMKIAIEIFTLYSDEIEEYLLSLYPEKERIFRKTYHMSSLFAYKHHTFNKEEIRRSDTCGCFHCRKIFRSSEIKDWSKWYSGETAVCPYCKKIFVIGDASGLPVDKQDFIDRLSELWFVEGINIKG